MTSDDFRALAAALPGVEEGSSYGTPGWRCRKKLLARLWEDGETLVIGAGFDEREILLEAAPETFFITEHYRGYPWVLVRLARAEPDAIGQMLVRAWREAAPRKVVATYDAKRSAAAQD